MLMVMTLYMGSCAPPAMSDPRVTQMPCCSISRTGDTPLHRLMLDPAQWYHHHPYFGGWRRTPGRRSGRSGHHRVVLPKAVFVIGLPILGAVRVQLLHPGDLPPVFRQMGLDIQPPVPGDLPQGGHQLVGTAGGEAGGDNGLTCSKWQPSSQRRVSETDSSVVSWRMPGRALRFIFTLPT